MSCLVNQSILINDKHHQDEQGGTSCVSVGFSLIILEALRVSVVFCRGNHLMSQTDLVLRGNAINDF